MVEKKSTNQLSAGKENLDSLNVQGDSEFQSQFLKRKRAPQSLTCIL